MRWRPVHVDLRLTAARGARLLWMHAGLLGVLVTALVERLAFLRWWKAFPGGDTYNFILAAQELLRGSYPIAEKRLPLYPALIAAAHPVLDWEPAAIAIALVGSLLAIVLLYALGRTLGISKFALVASLFVFQAIAPFLFQSVRGYADTVFAALLLATILTILRATTTIGVLGAGLLLGATVLTRPEGMVLVPVVLIVQFVRAPHRLGVFVLGIALMLLPFLLLNARIERPLTPREYLSDAETTAYGVADIQEFARNYAALWVGIGIDRLWGEPLRILRDVSQVRPETLPERAWSFLTDPKELPSILMLLGVLALARSRPRRALLALLPFLAVAGVIAWWGVRQRFLLVLYPVSYLLLAAGIDVAIQGTRRLSRMWPAGSVPPPGERAAGDAPEGPTTRTIAEGPHPGTQGVSGASPLPGQDVWGLGVDRRKWEDPVRQDPLPRGWAERKAGHEGLVVSAAKIILLLLALGPWRAHTAAEAREVQQKNLGRDYAYYQAIQAARGLPGRIVFDHRASIVLALFGEIDNRGRAAFADVHFNTPDAAEQWRELQRREIRYLVIQETAREIFPVLSDPRFSDRIRMSQTFAYPEQHGTDRAAIYEVNTGLP